MPDFFRLNFVLGMRLYKGLYFCVDLRLSGQAVRKPSLVLWAGKPAFPFHLIQSSFTYSTP